MPLWLGCMQDVIHNMTIGEVEEESPGAVSVKPDILLSNPVETGEVREHLIRSDSRTDPTPPPPPAGHQHIGEFRLCHIHGSCAWQHPQLESGSMVEGSQLRLRWQ
jgi:hypothetical protein